MKRLQLSPSPSGRLSNLGADSSIYGGESPAVERQESTVLEEQTEENRNEDIETGSIDLSAKSMPNT